MLGVCLILALFSLGKAPLQEEIRVLPVNRTPESSTAALRVAVPEQGEVLKGNPVWVQFRIDGYSLGSGSQSSRVDEIVETSMGQTVHVIVDDRPYFAINEPALDPFDDAGYFYDMRYKFEIPYKLEEGMHVLRAFPARSFGESLKGERTFTALSFYLGEEKDNPQMDLSAPYLTYNEPSNQMHFLESKPLLLDFLIANCELSPDGYKVELAIDGKARRTLTSWQPYYIYGLKRGKHAIRLRLLDREGKVVPGLFNEVEQAIQVY